MKRTSAALYTATLLLLTLAPLHLAQSQGVDLAIAVEPRDPCIAGYPCEVTVSVRNLDGIILLDYVKLITPWGAFTRNLGLRELRPNSTIFLPVVVNVDRNSLEGSNFVRPVVSFFKKGGIGMRMVEGNASSIMVIKPSINASLLAVPRSLEVYFGDPLVIDISYEVEGIPKEYHPSLSVYVDDHLEMKRELNGTSGEATLSVPVGGEGNHKVTVRLCYGIGCVDKSFEVAVYRKITVVSGYARDKEELSKALEGIMERRRILQVAYERAVEYGLPISEAILVNLSVLDSKIKEVESLLAEENISYTDVVRANALLSQSSSIISDLEKEFLSTYRNRLTDLINSARQEIEGIRNLNRTEYERMKKSLNDMEERLGRLNLSSTPDFYSNFEREVESLLKKAASMKEKAAEEARLLSGITVLLMFVTMISSATIILRKWKSQLMKE